MGRPTKCTPEVVERICEALALGVSWAAAAAHAGMSEAALTEWKQRGNDGEEPFAAFLAEATRARDAAEVRMASIVIRAAEEGDAKAAQWWLERRRSASWGRQDSMAVTVEKADPAAVLAAALTKLEPTAGADP